MFGINKKKKSDSNEVYDGNWNFINPRWIIILLLLAEAGNYVLGITEINKQLYSFMGGFPQNDSITVICCVVVITLLIIFCVKKLPESTSFDHLRLSCIFIIIGFVIKLFNILFVNEVLLSTNDHPLSVIAVEDIYIIAGIIGFIVLLKTEYKQYSLKELIRGEKISNSEEEPVKEKSKKKHNKVIWLFLVVFLLGTFGLFKLFDANSRAARITIINNTDQPTNGLQIIATASTNPEPSVVADGVYVPEIHFFFYGIPVGKSISMNFPDEAGLNDFSEYPRYFTVRIEESKDLSVEYNDSKRKINKSKYIKDVKFTKTEMRLTGIVIENKHEAVLRIEGNAKDGYSLVYDHDNKPLIMYWKRNTKIDELQY